MALLLFLAQLGEKEEKRQRKLFNAADKENCFLMTAKKVLPTIKKKDLFGLVFLAPYLLAGVPGAVAAGAAAVLTLRMRAGAPLRVEAGGVARGVAVTRAAPALGVDVGRRRPWQ